MGKCHGIGVILVLIRPGVRHFSAWHCLTGDHIRKGIAALHARLNKVQDGADIFILICEGKVYKPACIDHEDYLFIKPTDIPDIFCFLIRQIKVSLLVEPVRPFPGHAAQHINRDVRVCLFHIRTVRHEKRAGRICDKKFFFLCPFQDPVPPCNSRVRVDPVIGINPVPARHGIAGVQQSLVNVHDLSLVDIPGACAALDHVGCSRTVERYPASLRKRKGLLFIFQQYDSFARCFSRRCTVGSLIGCNLLWLASVKWSLLQCSCHNLPPDIMDSYSPITPFHHIFTAFPLFVNSLKAFHI